MSDNTVLENNALKEEIYHLKMLKEKYFELLMSMSRRMEEQSQLIDVLRADNHQLNCIIESMADDMIRMCDYTIQRDFTLHTN